MTARLVASREIGPNTRHFEFESPEWPAAFVHGQFLGLARQFPNCDYRPTLTRPPETWTGLTGRVQPHVLTALGDRRDVDVYICGLREMVDSLRQQLKSLGLDRKRMIYEKYD